MQTKTKRKNGINDVEHLEEEVEEVESEVNSLRERVRNNTQAIAENRKMYSVMDERTAMTLKLLFTVLIGFVVSIAVKLAEAMVI